MYNFVYYLNPKTGEVCGRLAWGQSSAQPWLQTSKKQSETNIDTFSLLIILSQTLNSVLYAAVKDISVDAFFFFLSFSLENIDYGESH